jgi:undecaprenyl diphosphate synthase
MSGLHVAIIMDGNGRWARAHGKPRWRGHVAGVESVRRVVRASTDLGVDVLTLYAFSSDNWKRPPTEVGRLFWLLRNYCIRERDELVERGVRLTAIGRRDRIPTTARKALEQIERDTAAGTKLELRLAIDYSARASIADAARHAVAAVAAGELSIEDLTEGRFDDVITQGVAPPDLLIRTAGEKRLSDFLLWEIAYSELHFTTTVWPEFGRKHLREAIADFYSRRRRFGGLPDAPETVADDVELDVTEAA